MNQSGSHESLYATREFVGSKDHVLPAIDETDNFVEPGRSIVFLSNCDGLGDFNITPSVSSCGAVTSPFGQEYGRLRRHVLVYLH